MVAHTAAHESMTKRITGGYESGDGCQRRQVRYRRDGTEPLSVAVATALAQYRDEDVTASSTRLYEHIDPEALDALFADRYDGRPRADGQVRFVVDDATVVVRSDSVQVYPGA